MTKYLWLCHSSGGNLPPSLGIARVLRKRGGEVSFFGKSEMVPRIEAAGFRAIDSAAAYAQVDAYPEGGPLSRTGCFLTSTAVMEEIRTVVAAERPDALLVD